MLPVLVLEEEEDEKIKEVVVRVDRGQVQRGVGQEWNGIVICQLREQVVRN